MQKRTLFLAMALLGIAFLLKTETASAHCDTMSGPVVGAARQALQSGDPAPALVWVKPEDEAKIKKAFAKARAARKGGSEADKEKADREFFETLVRVHREGEGAEYTGLKPAGTDLGPIVPLADKAYETGGYAELADALKKDVDVALAARVAAARELKAQAGSDVPKGREAVEAYVSFVHWSEELHNVLSGAEHAEAAGAEPHRAEGEHAPAPAQANWWQRLWGWLAR